jgi:NAD-dependent dihydropyrimidine dehydrogenase PreA subunit
MTFVISQLCADVKDKSCIVQCPVDCIYEGERSLYINPEECIDCGACEPACPTEAIYHHADLPTEYSAALASTHSFFFDPLPGRTEPVGSPGGFRKVGPTLADSPFVASLPASPADDCDSNIDHLY